jgi:hypothetical protein
MSIRWVSDQTVFRGDAEAVCRARRGNELASSGSPCLRLLPTARVQKV